MAEDNAAKEAVAAAAVPVSAPSQKPPILLVALAVVNMLVVAGVGFMLWQGKKKEAAQPTIDHVVNNVANHPPEHEETNTFEGKVIPLETFIINLAGSKGRRIAKVSMELKVEGEQTPEEIDKRKAQIRDIIIILLSGKTYDEVSNREGKDQLRSEIKDTVNAFLTKGKINEVYFTEFIYQ